MGQLFSSPPAESGPPSDPIPIGEDIDLGFSIEYAVVRQQQQMALTSSTKPIQGPPEVRAINKDVLDIIFSYLTSPRHACAFSQVCQLFFFVYQNSRSWPDRIDRVFGQGSCVSIAQGRVTVAGLWEKKKVSKADFEEAERAFFRRAKSEFIRLYLVRRFAMTPVSPSQVEAEDPPFSFPLLKNEDKKEKRFPDSGLLAAPCILDNLQEYSPTMPPYALACVVCLDYKASPAVKKLYKKLCAKLHTLWGLPCIPWDMLKHERPCNLTVRAYTPRRKSEIYSLSRALETK